MTFRHVWVSLAALSFVAACSSDDTIVALNVAATDRVPAVKQLQLTLTQGSHKLVRELTPPSEKSNPPEGEEPITSIKNSFFERITLPGDWDEADAKLVVELFNEDGERFDPPLVDETTVKIQPNAVVAAYVDFDIPEEPPPGGEGGAGGAGAGGDGAGGADAGGADAGGADAGGAGPSSGGASGGEPSAGGAPIEETGGVGGAG